MTGFVLALFVATYAGMALGRFPGLKVDRNGIALIAAVVLVAAGGLDATGVLQAIHFPTILLLASLMIVSGRLAAAGFYDAAASWIARHRGGPHLLLGLTVAAGGVLSALLVNDIVVFAMTPLLCTGMRARGLDPRPYLLALAAASNAGSAATLIGNPQNILIGQAGGLDFWQFLAVAAAPAAVALAVVYAAVAWVWRVQLGAAPGPAELEPTRFDRRQTAFAGAGVLLLLALFASPLPRELSALMVAALMLVSRRLATRKLIFEIDWPLLVLFAALFVVNGALAATGLPQAAVAWLDAQGLLPQRALLMAPLTLLLSNTIGNVPAVVMILSAWQQPPAGALIGLALFSTLAGNLFLVGSLANLIVAERAAAAGVALGFRDFARSGVPITLISMAFAGLWLALGGFMAL